MLLKDFVIDEICYLMILIVNYFKTSYSIELSMHLLRLNLTMEGPPDSVNHHLDLCGDRRPLFDATNRIKLRPIANDRYSFEDKAFPLTPWSTNKEKKTKNCRKMGKVAFNSKM